MARLKKGPFILLGLVVAAAVTNCRMNGVADDAAAMFGQGGNVRYEGAKAGFDGTLHYEDIAVWPDLSSETTEATRAGSLTMTTPGLGWLFAGAFSNLRISTENRGFRFPDEWRGTSGNGRLSAPAGLETLSFRADDVVLDRDATAFFLPSWLGAASLSPFDGLGCTPTQTFTADDLTGQLELPAAPYSIQVDVTNPMGAVAEVKAVFARPGIATTTFVARYDMGSTFDPANLDFDAARLKEATWTINDEGFVAARNRVCANLIGLSEKRYQQIHIVTLRRQLLAAGLIPDQTLEDAYAQYLRAGGTLVFRTNPKPDYKQQLADSTDLVARAQLLGYSLKSNADPVDFNFFAVTPSEWNDELLAKTITNLIQQAKSLDNGSLVLVDDSSTAWMENLLLMESSTAVVDSDALPFVAGEAVDTGDADSDVLVEKVPIESLPKAIGQKVVVTTVFGSRREGILKSANSAGATVYTDLRGQMADVNIPKSEIQSVEVHWNSVQTE